MRVHVNACDWTGVPYAINAMAPLSTRGEGPGVRPRHYDIYAMAPLSTRGEGPG